MFQQELQDGEDVARCPSCSLIIRVIYDLASICKFHIHCYFCKHQLSSYIILDAEFKKHLNNAAILLKI